MRRALGASGLALLLAACVLVPGSASACACGEFDGPVVAHGTSPAGAPWWVKAIGLDPEHGPERAATFEFSYGPARAGGDGTGGFSGLPLALRRHPFITATRGGEVGPYAEYDVSGVVQARATRLVVRFAAGEPIEAEPQLPPRALRDRLHWLRGFRFYDVFFPEEAEPIRIQAFDRDGALIAGLGLSRPD